MIAAEIFATRCGYLKGAKVMIHVSIGSTALLAQAVVLVVITLPSKAQFVSVF